MPGNFPSIKTAVVKPLSKTGNKSSMTNYRPTSLLMVFSKVHSIIKHRIILGVNSCKCGKIFTVQKKTIRIMSGAQPRTSGRSLSKQLRDSNQSMPVHTFI